MNLVDAAALLDPAPMPLEMGYERLKDGVLHIAVRTDMHRCTGEMVEWWFRFRPNTQQYVWWHPIDHVFSDWIECRQGCADSITAAFVEPGAAHATSAGGANRALVLDLAPSIMSDLQLERMARTPFVTLTAAAGKLVEFMALSLDQSPSGASLQHWVPLLLDTLAQHRPQARSRLHRMLAQVEAQVARPWNRPGRETQQHETARLKLFCAGWHRR